MSGGWIACAACGVSGVPCRVLLRAKGFRLDASGHEATPHRLQPLASQNHRGMVRLIETPQAQAPRAP
jgi:hypothetical protein